MELIQGSETSANYNLTPGKYPEENIQIEFSLYCPVVKYIIAQVETELSWELLLFKGGIVAADRLLSCDPV